MRQRIALILIAAALAGGPAHAENRHFALLRLSPGAWTLVDPNGIEQDVGGVVRRTWTVTVQKSIVGGVDVPGYVRTLREVDCAARQTRWRKFLAYARSGDLVLSQSNSSNAWVSVGSSAETDEVMRVVCEGAMPAVISGDSIARVVIALLRTWDEPSDAKLPVQPPPRGKANTPR